MPERMGRLVLLAVDANTMWNKRSITPSDMESLGIG